MSKSRIEGFPFEYGKTILFDELKIRAYRQQIERYQRQEFTKEEVDDFNKKYGNVPEATVLAIQASQKKKQAWDDSEIKRDAFYTAESVNRYFGLKAQLRHHGFWGKLISWLLK